METNISTFYNLRTLLLIIAVSLIYYFSLQFFLPPMHENSGVVPVWPAAGIAFSVLLLFGYRVWPAVLLGAFTANFFFLASGYTGTLYSAIWTSSFISIAHTSEALLGVFLLKKVSAGIYKLEKVKHVFQFSAIILVMGLWGSVVCIGSLCVTQIIPWQHGLITWLGWWLGDSIAILTITPMLLGWAMYTEKKGEWNRQIIIAVLLALLTFVVSGIVFFNWIPALPFIKPYFIIPLFLWVAFYFELRIVTMVLAVSAFVAIYGTIEGDSFFISDDMAESYISLQLYIAIITGSTLILKAALDERKQSALALQQAHDSLLVKVHERSEELHNYQDRVNAIFNTLVKYTVMDFSEKIHITEQRDEIDAIATGLNTLGEELEAATIAQLKYANELEQTNLLLIDSEQQIQSIFNNAPDSVMVIDMDNIVMRWNPQAELTFGWKRNEIVGKPLYQFIIPKRNKASYIKEMQHFFTGKEKVLFNKTVELDAVDKYGVEFPVSLSISPVMMGGKYMFIGFLRNVTDQKKAEKKIKQLAAIVESSDDAIISQSLDGIILSWNKAAEVIYGYSAEEVIGKPISITSPSDQDGELETIPTRLQQGEQVINIEIQKVKKDNHKIYVSLTASPIKDNAGKITAISLISRDITENKKIISEMARITEELKRSNAELEQFAYVASHDLQEPLRMVTSYLQLLEKRYASKLDPEAFEFINYAVDGSKRMRNLIHSLLEYSRINRIKPFESIDLRELLSDVLLNLNASIEESNAIIKIDELPDIYGDYVLINQLFQNLIGNGVKFNTEEKPEITISGRKLKDEFLFTVKDNGIGFQKEYAEKVFVIFQRLHGKEKYPGTGMGLAICKKIVERHGGRIWVESEPGKGSTFYFTIKIK